MLETHGKGLIIFEQFIVASKRCMVSLSDRFDELLGVYHGWLVPFHILCCHILISCNVLFFQVFFLDGRNIFLPVVSSFVAIICLVCFFFIFLFGWLLCELSKVSLSTCSSFGVDLVLFWILSSHSFFCFIFPQEGVVDWYFFWYLLAPQYFLIKAAGSSSLSSPPPPPLGGGGGSCCYYLLSWILVML